MDGCMPLEKIIMSSERTYVPVFRMLDQDQQEALR